MATDIAVLDKKSTTLQRGEQAAIDAFTPQNWEQLMRFADMVARTDFAPKDFRGKPEACAIAMLYGRNLGIDPLQAIQNIAVINGRPSVWGDLFWAIILSHPEFEDVKETATDTGATVILKRRGRSAKEATFTQKDAETAGLWKKAGPWTQYPKNQMLWRARTIAGRALFADALKGLTSSAEAEDFQGVTIEGSLTTTPTPAAETATKTAEPAKITEDEAREFGKAWKASGFSVADAKRQLPVLCGVNASLDIPKDKYQDAMRWATKNPNWPDAPPAMSPDEKICREMFGILGYDLTQQAEAIAAAEGNWTALATRLNEELPAE